MGLLALITEEHRSILLLCTVLGRDCNTGF